jgi:DnaD/phage-associated family protein
MEKAIWLDSTPEQKVILITLLMMANHEGREWEWEGKQFKADPGQFVTSLESITIKCGKGITLKNVRTALKRFEKYGFLANQSTKTGRLITIVNWRVYQGLENEPGKASGSQLAKTGQTPGKDRATNKNDKNDKNVRITTTTENPIQLFEKLLCRLSPNQMDNLYAWQDDFGGEAEIINEAIKIADDKNKRHFGFVEYLLKEWSSNNLKSIERVKAYEQEKFRKEAASENFNKQPRKGHAKVTRNAEDSITGGQVGWIGRNKNL